jgi:hypothetical protein
MANGKTRWSEQVPGDVGNYDWPAQFAVTDGYVNVYQKKPDGSGTESVLLSPAQVRELVKFLRVRRPVVARRRALETGSAHRKRRGAKRR